MADFSAADAAAAVAVSQLTKATATDIPASPALQNLFVPVVATPVFVLGVSPADGTVIDATEPLVVEVRSAAPLVRVVLSVRYAGWQFREVVYDADPAASGAAGYEDAYAATSLVSLVTDVTYPYHYRFQLLRATGWPASPELHVVAFNNTGLEV